MMGRVSGLHWIAWKSGSNCRHYRFKVYEKTYFFRKTGGNI
jgi:hypothetical protein